MSVESRRQESRVPHVYVLHMYECVYCMYKYVQYIHTYSVQHRYTERMQKVSLGPEYEAEQDTVGVFRKG